MPHKHLAMLLLAFASACAGAAQPVEAEAQEPRSAPTPSHGSCFATVDCPDRPLRCAGDTACKGTDGVGCQSTKIVRWEADAPVHGDPVKRCCDGSQTCEP